MSQKKRRGCWVALAALVVVGVGLYSGLRWAYYQGWWGEENYVARYLWLCDAPPGFERTLYPENVEILVPACENMSEDQYLYPVFFSSDSEYIAVKKEAGLSWIDLTTGNITSIRPTTATLESCRHTPKELLSPDGRWIAKRDGIYAAETGEKLLDYGLSSRKLNSCMSPDTFSPCVWLPDNSGVILSLDFAH